MKAAVLHNFGGIPKYEDFADPVAGENEILIKVKAVALENVDKMMAEGTHFASRQFLSELPAIVGFDGIGELADGRIVGFGGTKAPFGAMAEKTVVPQLYTVPVPDGISAVIAAAVPASALTALIPLKLGANLQAGETVLINGATGVSGKLAVQIAKLLGAGRVVGTGRNPQSLQQILELGADAAIDLKQPDEQLAEAFKKEAGPGYDIVLDFLWGHPTEVLIGTLIPDQLGVAKRKVHLIQIGEMAGANVTIPAGALRTTGLEISGVGSMNLTPERIAEATNQVWEWIKQDKLHMDIEEIALKDVEEVWKRTDFQGKRIVIIP